MSVPRIVVVTGPIGRADEYAAAARAAGFAAVVRELLAIRPRPLDARMLPASVDIVCATSKHAVQALRDVPRVPAAVVGDETAARVRELGFELALPAARDAAELASALATHLRAHRRPVTVFWPRGSLSDELARDLRGRGVTVIDPIVYETVALQVGSLPRGDLVFLASPSAVQAYAALGESAPKERAVIGIAAGATTAAAMREVAERFRAILTLDQTTPEAFERALRELAEADA